MDDPIRRVSNSILSSLESLPPISSHCCIYRVPEKLRRVNKDAYQPTLVSIGPYYYNDGRFKTMQQHKLRYMNSFLTRSPSNTIYDYAKFVRECEEVARECYEEKLDLLSEDFIEMTLVDAVFIIELFLRGCFPEFVEEDDHVFNKPTMISEVTRDITLLENQLPFFVLKGVYDLAFEPSLNNDELLSFHDIAYNFFTRKNVIISPRIATEGLKHLVDFFRLCMLPSILRGEIHSSNKKFEFTSSVTDLCEAGVKFRASKNESSKLDIKFIKGVLVIPRMVLDDNVDSLFRNIMVFEQCHYYTNTYIIDYIMFLGSLINTPKDVAILVQNGVIDNRLGSNNEEVVNLFDSIIRQISLDHPMFYYWSICNDLNAYANTSWKRCKVILKRDYFNHPWAAISVLYAIVILILMVLLAASVFVLNF